MNPSVDTPTHIPENAHPTDPAPVAGASRAPRVRRRGCLPVAAGVALVLIGLPMLVCPGPGMAVLASGFGMIAVGLGLKRGDKGS